MAFQEKEAIRKLEKVKLDQQKRLDELKTGQEKDIHKAELITANSALVETAINAIRKLVANQVPWETIDEQIKEARSTGDPLASVISELNLKQNSITLLLKYWFGKRTQTLQHNASSVKMHDMF